MYRTSEKTNLSRKMAELEDRWRKSQEGRYMLELKFKEVLKGLANKNEGNKLMRIREKYNRFLENEDSRNERNDRILQTLDKIESQANMLSAKTERLKLLKLHYEAYMKRMYPSWKEELDSGEVIIKRDPVYSGNRRSEPRNVAYGTRQDETNNRNDSCNLQYSPRHRELAHCNHNDKEHGASGPKAKSSSNYQLEGTKLKYSSDDSNVAQNLNPELSRVGKYSEEKTSSSLGPSVEQEENTSKDLLNVSLSDDIVINDSTVLVEADNIRGHQENSINADASRHYKEGNGTERFSRQDNAPGTDENIVAISEEMNGAPPSDYESRMVKGTSTELRPNVVVTQPTPDIGKSSSEDDVSSRGIEVEGESKRQRYISSHENFGVTSEAEVSEVEGVAGGSGDQYKHDPEHLGDEEEAARLTTALGNNHGNVEEAFQFSSSDADYDELENQMAALVEGKRNDKRISKHMHQSGYQSSLDCKDNESTLTEYRKEETHDKPTISTDAMVEEINQQFNVNNRSFEGNDGDVGHVPAGPESESLKQKDEFSEHLIPDTSSDKGDISSGGGNVEESDGLELNDGAYRVDEQVGNRDHVKYEGKDVIEGDDSMGEHEERLQYYEGQQNAGEQDLYKYDSDKISQENPDARLEEGYDEQTYDEEYNKPFQREGTEGTEHDDNRNPDYQVEKEGEVEVVREEGYAQSDADDGVERETNIESEFQGETWQEEGKEAIGSVFEESQSDIEGGRQEHLGGIDDEYLREEGGEGSRAVVEEESDYDREETRNEIVERENDFEEITENVGNVETYQQDEEEGELYDTHSGEKETEETEFVVQGERNPQEVDDENETEDDTTAVINRTGYDPEGMELETGKFKSDEDEKLMDVSSGYVVEDTEEERGTLLPDPEREQYDDYRHEGEIEKVTETNVHEEEQVENTELTKGNYPEHVRQEVEEMSHVQHEATYDIERDTSKPIDDPPKSEEVAEELTAMKEEQHSHDSETEKKLHEGKYEEAQVEQVSKAVVEEIKTAPVKAHTKGEIHVEKPARGVHKEKEPISERASAEKAERHVKEGSQVPSRPLSRQSTRKDGPSPDSYKGEKLKTAIRKFQAKKDTRQTGRRSTDTKK